MTQEQGSTAREMPRYKSHKHVWALKIKKLVREELPKFSGANLQRIILACDWERSHGPMRTHFIPEEEGYGPIPLDEEYLRKHNPQVGGYYVVYADGYKSWSPAQAFEEGYTRV